MYTTAQVWVPAGLRGAHSGRLKSRDPAVRLLSLPWLPQRRTLTVIQVHSSSRVAKEKIEKLKLHLSCLETVPVLLL